MKKKIFRNITLLATLSVLVISILLVYVFYNFNIQEQNKFLKDYTHLLAKTLELNQYKDIEKIIKDKNSHFRSTIIDSSGNVILDSSANLNELDNHLYREEIQDAFNTGKGESFRHSTTINKNIYYYAILLSNNSVLRVSIQTDNILSVFVSTIPTVLLIIISILVISLIISSVLVKRIFLPIEEIALNIDEIVSNEDYNKFKIYDELLPFIKIVSKQKKEIKKNIKDLEEKANMIEVITSNMQEGLILVDNNKFILSSNLAAIRILGGSDKTSYYGMEFIKLCRNIDINQALKDVLHFQENKDITTKSNEKYLNILINLVKSNGIVRGAIILIVDSTEKQKLELRRREFSSNVSHELKSPLTIINGYAEIIETGMADHDHITRFASIIRSEGLRLLDIIDSVIRLSNIEEKQIKEFSSIDLFLICKSVIERLSLKSEKKDIKINLTGEKIIVKGNETMISELLFNLVQNSIKYTNSGGTIIISTYKDQDYSYIKVTDNGIGIPKNLQARVFERFFIVDKSRSKENQSVGLGLAIVKHIVDYHNGSISLKSTENKGTEITVKLPI